ncbi:MAG: PLP-dependent aminotransferase family protein [Burkholderiaceae bacterium]
MTLMVQPRTFLPQSPSGDVSARDFLSAAGRRRLAAGTHKYLGVVEALETGIRQGALEAGAQLPPQRELAALFGTTVATVTKAVAEAARRGIITARSGSGTYVAATPGEGTSERWGDLSLNIPPVAVSADIVSASCRRMTQANMFSRVLDYAPVSGSAVNRSAGVTLFGLRGVRAQPERVLVTQGAHQGLLVALMALTRPGDSVACERLNYSGLRRIADLLQVKLVGIDSDADGMVVSQLRSRLREGPIKAVVCTPSGHNPTSFVLSERRRADLVRFARSASVPVVEDDIYGLLAGDGLPPLAALWPEGTVCVTSLSKCVAPGLRVGFSLLPPAWVSRAREALLSLGWTESSLQAALATDLIQTGGLALCVARHQTEARKRVTLAHSVLPANSIQTAAHAASYHLWVGTGRSSPADIAAELSRRGILVSPAAHFLMDGSQAPHALRVSLGGAPSAAALQEPLRELAGVLQNGSRSAYGAIV